LCLAISGGDQSYAADASQAVLAEASAKIGTRDFQAARAILATLLKENPKIPEAYNLMGVCQVELGALDAAVASFRRAMDLKPVYDSAQLNLAGALQKQGKQAQAEDLLRSAVRAKPGFTDARIALAKLLLADKQDDVALDQFEAVIARRPDQVFALGNAGLILARRADYAKAIERLSRAHTLDPGSTPLALALAEAQIRSGRQADADRVISELQNASRLNVDAARILASVCLQSGQPYKGAALVKSDAALAAQYRDAAVRRAQDDFLHNRYRAAATELEALKSLGPQDFSFYKLLGTAYYQLGDPQKASDEFQNALRLDPKNEQVYFNLGMLYLKFHTPELAHLVFDHGLKELPRSPLLWMGMGLTEHLTDQTDKAAAALKKAIELDSAFADAYIVLGDVLESDNQLEDALPVFQTAIQKQPDLYIGYYYSGKILLKINDSRLNEAIAALRKAVRLRPEFAEGHFELGRALEHAGQIADAIAEYEASVQRDPDLAEGQYHLAKLYRKQGDVARANLAMAAFKKAQAAQESDGVMKKLDYRIGNQ
jgi:predicted Zn-dependent protease